MTPESPDEMDPKPGDALDEALGRSAEELRGSTRSVDGRDVIASSLSHKLARSRRLNVAITALSALVVVAMIGVVAAERRSGQSASGTSKGSVSREASDPAVRLVDSLPPQPVDPHAVKLIASVSRYDSCDALAGELRKVGAAHVGSRGFGNSINIGLMSGEGFARMAAADSASDQTVAFSGESETLGTNVIVAGVDEPDSVKASGSLVVDLNGSTLRVTDTRVPAVVGTLDLGVNGDEQSRYAYPSSLLVDGTRVVVFGDETVSADPLPGDPSATRPQHSYLTVTFIDLADPAKPAMTDRVRIEGGLVAARRVGNDVRIVTNSSLADLPLVMPTSPNSVAPALRQNRLAVAESSVDDWIPNWDHGESTPAKALMGCSDVVVPDTFAGVQMTSMVQFPLDRPFEPRALGLLAPSENLTASATDVVIASHVWVDPIDQTDDFTDWSTALHRFTFDDSGPKYIASGSVDGSVRDEFSLSALDDGTVGVVTVDAVPWGSRDKATVTVRLLASDSNKFTLNQVGSLVPESSGGGVAGVRFMGDRLLVTSGDFANIVSSVDLTNRSAPTDLGSVPLDGTGDYLQPIGDNRVLVLGTTMKGEGQSLHQGLQASLMDLNAAPQIVGRWALDYSYSRASYDHHAFTWWPSRSIAAFGVTHSAPGSAFPPPPEAAFLRIDGAAIAPRLIQPREADLGPRCPLDQIDHSNCDDTGAPDVMRVLVVDGSPWLFTSESLEQLNPESFAPLALVPLRSSNMYGMMPR